MSDLRLFSNWLSESNDLSLDKFFMLAQDKANLVLLHYKNMLLERKYKPASIRRKLNSTRALVRIANMVGLVSWTLTTPRVPLGKKTIESPDEENFKRFMDTMANRTTDPEWLALRDYTLVKLLYDLGLRISEAVSISVKDISFGKKVIRIRRKGDVAKTAWSMTDAVCELAKRLAELSKSGLLFENLSHDPFSRHSARLMMKEVAASIGIENFHPHLIRHRAITDAILAAEKEGIPFDEVATFSNHKSPQILNVVYRDHIVNRQKQISGLISGKY